MTHGADFLAQPHRGRVPLLDVNRSQMAIREHILAALSRVCDSGQYLHGPDVAQFEKEIAKLCGVQHAVSCASGSDALLLALMAVGVGPGDEVIVPSFTFFATASPVSRLGAKIVFVDIDLQTFNIDPQAIEDAITPATKAIIPVHLFGQCAEMDSICRLAERHGIHVIEDAAQAIAATYQGRAAGSWGRLACFSFYPTKNLGGFGDGGLITTTDKELADKVRLLASHGMNPRYYHRVVGINSRLDSIQAAVLNVKLTQLAAWTAERQCNATRYQQLFQTTGIDRCIVAPSASPESVHVWNQFTIRVPLGKRDELRRHLTSHEVGTEVYYPLPLHLQECFQALGYREGSLPNTELAAREVLSLPIFPGLTPPEQEAVVSRLSSFYRIHRAAA